MSKIVDCYIELNEMFQDCIKNQFEGSVSLEQLKLYDIKLDSFIAAAKEHYSLENVAIDIAINLFNNDTEVQKELITKLELVQQKKYVPHPPVGTATFFSDDESYIEDQNDIKKGK